MENSGTFDAVLEHDLRFLITVLRLCSALPQLRSVGVNLLRLASISWARPKIIEHGLSLGSFCWARSQIWHQLILSVASGGLRSASVEVSWYQFFEHNQRLLSTVSDCPHFTEHGLKFGLRLASALPQVVSTLPQLLGVTSIFWTRQNLAGHGLTLASGYWARSQFGLILLSTVSNLASVDPQRCLRWSPHCLSWGQLTSIFWARPNTIERGLSLASFCWALSQIWRQLILSAASGGLRIASVEASWHQFVEHDQIWLGTVSLWHQVGISWASAFLLVVKNPWCKQV